MAALANTVQGDLVIDSSSLVYSNDLSFDSVSLTNTISNVDDIDFREVQGTNIERIQKFGEFREKYSIETRESTLIENPNNIRFFDEPTQAELMQALLLGAQPMFLKELTKISIDAYIENNPAEFL